MSEADVERLKRTALFKLLFEKEKKEATEISLEDHEISENIITVVRKAAPLLERVPENMPEFTLHNANHSIHVIENVERIIPKETLENLNTIEISILIYAAYLHDIGMISSSDERNQIIETEEFKKLLTSDEELYNTYKEARDKGEYKTASVIEKKVFANFLRQNHVQHAHKVIKEYDLDSEISWRCISYCKWVRAVCNSHELPVKDLYNTKSWPNETYVLNKPVNVQYLAVVFRLADKLDIDPERTPKTLFYYISPKDDISISEWEKHLSITGFPITHEKIKIVADCKHPQIERTLRKFIREIDEELEDSLHLVLGYRDNLENKYKLKISEQIEAEIHSHGYEYCDFRFELDYRRVLDLLMGEGLYGDPIVALRELLQNSVDAVRYREFLEKEEGNGYEPHIEISLRNDELTVEDNGIGMNEEIFENYFMKVGRSYYQSLDFRKKNIDMDPVSEFGIGILSVFMIADNFTVESKRRTFEDEPPSKPIYFEIPTAYDYFVKRPSKSTKSGTKITLHLKPNHPFSAETLIKKISEIAPFLEYQIVIYTANGEERYTPSLPCEKMKKEGIAEEYFEIIFNDEKEGIEGKIRIITGENSSYKKFAQNGFAIPCNELLPRNLFFNIQASINLTGKAKLSLSPNRLFIVKDERYKRLIDIIQSRVLEEYEKYLKTLRDSSFTFEYVEIVNHLLYENVLNLSAGDWNQGFVYQEAELVKFIENIFLNYAALLTISDTGQRTYKVMKDLNTECLAIIGINDWAEKIPDEIILKEVKRFVGAETALLMSDERGEFVRNFFLKKILGNFSDIIITSIPGVVIKAFNNQISEGTFSIDSRKFTYRMHNHSKGKSPLFVHPPDINWQEEPDLFRDVIYNAQHPLFQRFLNYDKPNNETSSKAIRILTYQIEKCLDHLLDKFYSSTLKRIRGFETSANINYMLIGILKYQPQIFTEFSEAIEEYWVDAKDIGAISCEEESIGFSLDDLPWFWNYELSDFKFKE